jgi:IclR family transcriptional regulator, KDG regulon repressor
MKRKSSKHFVSIFGIKRMKKSSPRGSKTVRTLSRLLSLFSTERDAIGIREASQLLQLPPANIHRLFSSMEEVGFLEKTVDRRYRIGERLFEIGALFPHNYPLRKIARPHAEDLAQRFGVSVLLAIPSQRTPHLAVTIDHLQNWQSHFSVQRLSLNVPIHCSGVGKIIFAFSDPPKQEEIFKQIPLTRYTYSTIASAKILRAELKKIKKEGFAVDRCEFYENLFGVAAPLLQNGKIVGAIGLTDSVDRMNGKNYRKFAKVLMEKAAFISRQL